MPICLFASAGSGFLAEGQLFLDAGALAAAFAQVIQLGTAHVAAALDFDLGNQRAVGLERTFYAFAARNLAYGERAVDAAIALGNDHAFVSLYALAGPFHHVDAHDHRVAGGEIGDVFAQAG